MREIDELQESQFIRSAKTVSDGPAKAAKFDLSNLLCFYISNEKIICATTRIEPTTAVGSNVKLGNTLPLRHASLIYLPHTNP